MLWLNPSSNKRGSQMYPESGGGAFSANTFRLPKITVKKWFCESLKWITKIQIFSAQYHWIFGHNFSFPSGWGIKRPSWLIGLISIFSIASISVIVYLWNHPVQCLLVKVLRQTARVQAWVSILILPVYLIGPTYSILANLD